MIKYKDEILNIINPHAGLMITDTYNVFGNNGVARKKNYDRYYTCRPHK
jgi:hypothetical protein